MIQLRRRSAAGNRAVLPAIAVFGLVTSAVANGQEQDVNALMGADQRPRLDLSIHAGADRTDNVRRTQTNEQSDTLGVVGVIMDISREFSSGALYANGNLDRVEYFESDYQGRQFGSADVLAVIGGPDRLLRWNVRDTYGQLQSDPFVTTTAENLDSVNFFSTGPELKFAPSAITRLLLTGTYSRADYRLGPYDSQSLEAGLAYIREISGPTNSFSIRTSYQSVGFENETTSTRDYASAIAVMRYQFGAARMGGYFDLGYTNIDQQPGPSRGEPIIAVELQRIISPSLTAYLRATQGVSNSLDRLRENVSEANGSLGSPGGGGAADGLATAAVFKRRDIAAGWRWQRVRTSMTADLHRLSESYPDSPVLNRTISGIRVDVSRQVRPTVTLYIEGNFDRQHFTNQGGNVKELSGAVSLSKRVGRRLSIAANARAFSRRGASGSLGEYDETRYGLRFNYIVLASGAE